MPRREPQPERSFDEAVPVLIRTVAETGSTNDDLAALARGGAPEGSWLRAQRQTSGRGRQGREWTSAPGNLHASTLVRLRPGDPPAATLALVAAVALQEVAQAYVEDAQVRIKWPNDLLSGGAKLSGILLERLEDSVIIGFGVNLDQFPADTVLPSTSIRALSGSTPPVEDFLEELATSFAGWLSRWRSEGIGPVRARWLEKAHPPGTALSTVTASGAWVEGLFEGLEEDGALRLRLADGSSRVVHAGDVFLI
jgi:BirA family biotin operon repressor/biotin-[acetyl-CoA-carboxylase] ligase